MADTRRLLTITASPTEAIAAGALIGPAQVGARLLEAGPLSRLHPLITARLASLTHPIGIAVLLIAGGSVASSAFAVLLDNIGVSILFVTTGLSLAACAAFCALQAPRDARVHAD